MQPAAPDLRIYYFTIAINCAIAILVYFLSIRNLDSQKNVSEVRSSTDIIPA
jgi:hypothetical protein